MAEQPIFAQIPGLSRSAIDRAGERLERWWSAEEEPPASDDVTAAFMEMIAFRETFQLPLKKTVMGLRSMVRSEQPDLKAAHAIPVVQRLKRQEQMLNKLSLARGLGVEKAEKETPLEKALLGAIDAERIAKRGGPIAMGHGCR